MPLQKGKSKAVIRSNIREMISLGHPTKVAIAASLHTANPSKSPIKPKKSMLYSSKSDGADETNTNDRYLGSDRG